MAFSKKATQRNTHHGGRKIAKPSKRKRDDLELETLQKKIDELVRLNCPVRLRLALRSIYIDCLLRTDNITFPLV